MEKNINFIGEELFNKIRGRCPRITLGDKDGNVTNNPQEARFFDFDYNESSTSLGKVSISLDETSLNVMFAQNFVENQDKITKKNWYNFLRELRHFSMKRLLNFDIQDITKSNLNKRDYQFLAQTVGEGKMTESKLYGTSKTSYQDIGSARISIKHSQPVNHALQSGRTQYIENIYVENAEGERFKYPIKHLNGARAMARHVSEGGTMHDDFGKHIVGLSEELGKLKKFKNYVSRSSVMAEGLSEYADIVNDRITTVKKTIESIQKENRYREMVENFSNEDLQEVPQDVAENWIDQLTIKQFNEELQEVFPYIYKLISEKQAEKVTPNNIIDEMSGPVKLQNFKKPLPDGFEMVGVTTTAGSKYALLDTQDNTLIVPKMIGNAVGMEVYKQMKGEWDLQYSGPISSAGPLTKKYITYVHSRNEKKAPKVPTENAQFLEFEEWADDVVNNALSEDDLKPKQSVPVTEFILSMYDRETGQFPKGETAVLTAVEKDYGENLINPAKQFIEAINQKFREYNGYDTDADGVLMDDDVEERLIDPKPKSDRRYFVVPNMEDYYDIQNDRRFAGYIEVADENSEVMVLPNSAFHKLKMMYGNKVHEVDPQFTKTYEDENKYSTEAQDILKLAGIA